MGGSLELEGAVICFGGCARAAASASCTTFPLALEWKLLWSFGWTVLELIGHWLDVGALFVILVFALDGVFRFFDI